MAADSTVNIDVVLGGKDKFISDTKEINDIVKNIGKDSGNELEKDLSDNLDKSKTKAKQTHDDIEKEFKDPIKSKFDADDKPLRRKTEEVETALRKVPKEVITKITADAKEQGIASVNWFQFSVVNLPTPAVWVITIATDLNVSFVPPA